LSRLNILYFEPGFCRTIFLVELDTQIIIVILVGFFWFDRIDLMMVIFFIAFFGYHAHTPLSSHTF